MAGDFPLFAGYAILALPVAGHVPTAVVWATDAGGLGAVIRIADGADHAELVPSAEGRTTGAIDLEAGVGQNALAGRLSGDKQTEGQEQSKGRQGVLQAHCQLRLCGVDAPAR